MEKKTEEENEKAANNPLYQGTRGVATNPLYEATRGAATNPLYQATRSVPGDQEAMDNPDKQSTEEQ